jgi:PatG C-terminal
MREKGSPVASDENSKIGVSHNDPEVAAAELGRMVDPVGPSVEGNAGSLDAQPVPDALEGHPPWVYALGGVQAEFPDPSLEREFAQATGRQETEGNTDKQAFAAVLSDRENRYIVRRLCWIFTVQGIPTYRLVWGDPADVDLLVEAIQPSEDPTISLVIGVRGPLAPPETCGGLTLPIVAFDQLYTFSRKHLVDAIPSPDDVPADQENQFRQAAGELFDRLIDMADNAGATDEHRALNYSLVRYHEVYAQTARAHRDDKSVSAVEVRPSTLTLDVLDVIMTYTQRRTGVDEKWRFSVDVSGEFPFLVRKLSPYFER